MKLNILVQFIRKIISIIKCNEYEKLIKFCVFFFVKSNIYRIKSNIMFINIFRLKTLITTEEEYYMTVLNKALELIENEFGVDSTQSEKTNGIIQFSREEIKNDIIDFEKKEFLSNKFVSNKNTILNPTGMSSIIYVLIINYFLISD